MQCKHAVSSAAYLNVLKRNLRGITLQNTIRKLWNSLSKPKLDDEAHALTAL